jgi:hypothetical protein
VCHPVIPSVDARKYVFTICMTRYKRTVCSLLEENDLLRPSSCSPHMSGAREKENQLLCLTILPSSLSITAVIEGVTFL